jgi:hypothetical protein
VKFRTEIDIPKIDQPINHYDPIITFGSCFAENIGEILTKLRFSVCNNPFGVLYNPVSIYNSINLISTNEEFEEADLIFHNGEWHSFYHHSSFSSHNHLKALSDMNTKLQETRTFIQKSKFVIITYGTAFVYAYRKNGMIVSNCHKIPADQFDRSLLSVKDLKQSIKSTIEEIKELNPEINLIFSVSPIRHLKDGLPQNQRSKALLIVALQEIVSTTPNTYYFPAYEIMIDDLRDYRFYEQNLTHPNDMAIQYIWDKFKSACLSASCIETLKHVEKLNAALSHRVRNPDSEEHRIFIENHLKLLAQLKEKYEYLDFDEEIKYFLSQ